MTATVSPRLTAEADDRSSSSAPRLSLAPVGPAPPLLDGAWWPRSRDLGAELPALIAVSDPLWGRITRVTVNPTHWPAVPRNLLVVPPRTPPESAARLMAAASDPLDTATASRLIEAEARVRTAYEADRAVEAVWDSEGGHEPRAPADEPRAPAAPPGVPAVTATVPPQTMGR